MGRLNLQGTPWHYEYLRPNTKTKQTRNHYCKFLSLHRICQNKQSLLYGDECTTYMKHHCKYRYKSSINSQNNKKSHHQPSLTKKKKQEKLQPVLSQTISLSQIKYIRKQHSKYFKTKLKNNLKCPECKSNNIHRTQMEYCHGYAKHIIICDDCENKWEHLVDDNLISK